MKKIFLILLSALTLSCSREINFVILNSTGFRYELNLKLKNPVEVPELWLIEPEKKKFKLYSIERKEISREQMNMENDIIIVVLNPGEGLILDYARNTMSGFSSHYYKSIEGKNLQNGSEFKIDGDQMINVFEKTGPQIAVFELKN